MKHTLLLIILLCSPLLTIGQDQSLSSVPVLAGKHLQTTYPEAIVLDWIRLTPEHIAARFLLNEHEQLPAEAVYTNEGLWLRTQEDSRHDASLVTGSQKIAKCAQHAIAIHQARK